MSSRRLTGIAVLVAIATCASVDDLVYRSGPAPQVPVAGSVVVRYLGVSGLSIRWGHDHILTAPFYTRPSLLHVLVGCIRPDRDRILALAPPLGDVSALLVGHAHYDHLLDVPVIARELLPRDCAIYCNRTAAHQLAPARLVEPVHVLNEAAGTWHAAGRSVRIMPVLADHAPHFLGVRLWDGSRDEDAKRLPRRARRWRMGQPLAYVIDLLDPGTSRVRFRIYYQDAAMDPPAGIPPTMPDAKRFDLAVLCVASFAQVDRHPEAIVRALQPRLVLLTHWESFFRDAERPARTVPGTDVREFVRRLEQVVPPDCRYWLPGQDATFRFRAD